MFCILIPARAIDTSNTGPMRRTRYEGPWIYGPFDTWADAQAYRDANLPGEAEARIYEMIS